MKRFGRTIAGKIINFILCLSCITVMGLSIVGVVFLGNYGVYTHDKNLLKENGFKEITYRAMDHIAWMYAFDELSGRDFENTDYAKAYTNLRFWIKDSAGNVVGHNLEEDIKDIAYLEYRYSMGFQSVYDEKLENFYIESWVDVEPEMEDAFTIYAYVDPELACSDEYAFANKLIDFGYTVKSWIIPIGLLCGICSIVFFVLLMCGAGRRPNDEEIHTGVLGIIPTDILLLVYFAIYAAVIAVVSEMFYIDEITIAVAIVLGANILLGLMMTFAARIKHGSLLTNTLICKVCKWIWTLLKMLGLLLKESFGKTKDVVRNIDVLWRWIFIITGISFVELVFLLFNKWEGDNILIFWLVEKVIFLPIILYAILSLYKLKKGGEALAKGDLSYKTDTDKMLWDLKCHGENLNSIADGMAIAVEERLQSERMKTELITNVSHDIKTPLTSIINYARLIGDEPCNSEKHLEYAEVLVRKSEQLKRLLEDLVEISKANSGNLEVALEKCEAGVLMTQVAGEFEQRCKEKNLELITAQPENQIYIMADSRRIWRVFENLMNNACKYSLPHSRVYMSLSGEGNEAVFTFRNTSAAALNITPQELMERFVRGEESRTTEGNGLGLSIASSLTELQGGKMEIIIDGDLFKVVVRFSVVNE